MRRSVGWLLIVGLLGIAAYLAGRDYLRRHPQDVPWTSLSLNDPIGKFTASKIAGLGDEPARCRALLDSSGSSDRPVPPRRSSPHCGYEDGLRLAGRDPGYAPSGLVTSCPVAAALLLWEKHVVASAAQRHLGKAVVSIAHAGSYSCRRLYNRQDGPFSEHATADAVDILGFTLEGGEQVSVLKDWKDTDAEAAFLREVRNGACRLFSTVLSPDYNAAHRDHLHFDTAARGNAGWTVCR